MGITSPRGTTNIYLSGLCLTLILINQDPGSCDKQIAAATNKEKQINSTAYYSELFFFSLDHIFGKHRTIIDSALRHHIIYDRY